MKTYIFGYGSLINLESASRTLKRTLTRSDIFITKLENYQRNWLLWDNVFAHELQKEVKGVFLNISYCKNAHLNGVIFEVNETELSYFQTREKNYNCVDISELAYVENFAEQDSYKIYTFVGKEDFLLKDDLSNSFIFEKYIDIVETGVKSFGPDFQKEYKETTLEKGVPTARGTYSFINTHQQSAR